MNKLWVEFLKYGGGARGKNSLGVFENFPLVLF
jgi:hypothetical protein